MTDGSAENSAPSAEETTRLGVEFRHDWKTLGEQRIAHTEFPDGNARTLRTCAHCDLVKITVHFAGGGQVERRWRRPGRPEFVVLHMPPCTGPKPRPEQPETGPYATIGPER